MELLVLPWTPSFLAIVTHGSNFLQVAALLLRTSLPLPSGSGLSVNMARDRVHLTTLTTNIWAHFLQQSLLSVLWVFYVLFCDLPCHTRVCTTIQVGCEQLCLLHWAHFLVRPVSVLAGKDCLSQWAPPWLIRCCLDSPAALPQCRSEAQSFVVLVTAAALSSQSEWGYSLLCCPGKVVCLTFSCGDHYLNPFLHCYLS